MQRYEGGVDSPNVSARNDERVSDKRLCFGQMWRGVMDALSERRLQERKKGRRATPSKGRVSGLV